MNVLLLRSNPRKSGFTQKATDLVLEGLKSGGAEVIEVDLCRKTIESCTGCYHCWTANPGVCIFDDDMKLLLEQILAADLILCATPLYHYTVSAALLTCLERTLPLFYPAFETSRQGLFRNGARFPDQWKNKKLAYLAVGGMREQENFSALQETFRRIADGIDLELTAELIRPESFLMPYSQAHPKTIKTIENALETAGRELAMTGKVTEETTAKVATPISGNRDNFKVHSTIFWEYIAETQESGLDQKRAEQMVVRDVRVLMHEIVTYVDPEATKRIRATIQFVFPDVKRDYYIFIDKGTASLGEGVSAKADLTITVNQSDWAAMFLRETTPMACLSSGKIELKGDKSLFTRFDRLFPPPRE